MDYHIWTFGCQMNTADTQHLASELERMGHHAALDADEADILVVNTCVVRQSAEDKAMNRLMMLRTLKEQNPDKVIGVMGCMVGVRDPLYMRKRLPFVDVFLPHAADPLTVLSILSNNLSICLRLHFSCHFLLQKPDVTGHSSFACVWHSNR